MSGKLRTQKRTSDYKSAFTAEGNKLMRIYGVGDLLDEIWLKYLFLLRSSGTNRLLCFPYFPSPIFRP